MRVPLSGCANTSSPDLDTHALAERLAMTGTEGRARSSATASSALENFVVGRVIEAEQHPNADRLRVCVVDIGDATRRRSCAARRTSPPARRWRSRSPARSCPTGRGSAGFRCAAIESNGMILAEDEVAIGTEHDGIMVLERDGLGPRDAAQGRAPDRHRRARARDHRQPPGLPRYLRRRPRGPRRDRSGARAAAVARGPGSAGRGRRREGRGRVPRNCARASPRACSRTSRSGRARRG